MSPEAQAAALQLLILAASFLAVTLMVMGALRLATRGFKSYEEKYVAGATRTLDAMYLTMTAQQIIYLSFLSTLVVFILVGVTTLSLLAACLFGVAAFLAPAVIIRVLKWRRDKKFGDQLVDMLMSLGNSLRAGHSLPTAFEAIAREVQNPMGQEMRLLTQEMRLGVTMEDALAHLHLRMPGEDLDILITSILISREVGGNLAEVFDNISGTIRERHRIQGKIAAMTAQGKLQGAVVAFLPVAIFLFLNGYMPELVHPLYTSALGLAALAAMLALESAGVYTIWKLVTIEF